jgi:hypothetical protein
MTAIKPKAGSRLPVPTAAAKLARHAEVLAPGKLSRREWAKRINEAWDGARESAVAGFVQSGRELHAAKADLIKRGEWEPLLDSGELKFPKRVAQMLMSVATLADEKRNNVSFLPKLPPDYATISRLAQIAKKAPEVFQQMLADGTICPTLPRNDVASLLSKKHKGSTALHYRLCI